MRGPRREESRVFHPDLLSPLGMRAEKEERLSRRPATKLGWEWGLDMENGEESLQFSVCLEPPGSQELPIGVWGWVKVSREFGDLCDPLEMGLGWGSRTLAGRMQRWFSVKLKMRLEEFLPVSLVQCGLWVLEEFQSEFILRE